MKETEQEAVDRYGSILSEELGISLDELLARYEDEVSKTESEIFRAARSQP